MDDIWSSLANPPSHHLDILIDLLSGDLQLLLPVACHFDPQVLDSLDTLDAIDLLDVFLCEDLRLPLVEAEVPLLLLLHQLINYHCELALVVGHH